MLRKLDIILNRDYLSFIPDSNLPYNVFGLNIFIYNYHVKGQAASGYIFCALRENASSARRIAS